jgi:hypothetical protein
MTNVQQMLNRLSTPPLPASPREPTRKLAALDIPETALPKRKRYGFPFSYVGQFSGKRAGEDAGEDAQ